MFLNTFPRISILMNDRVKSYREKIVLKQYSWSFFGGLFSGLHNVKGYVLVMTFITTLHLLK